MKFPFFHSIILLVIFWGCTTESDEETNSPIELPPETELDGLYFPPNDSGEWQAVSFETLGWSTNAGQLLQDFLEERGTKAFIVLKDGRMVVEWYFDDHTQNTSWYWASAGKTLTAFTVGLAQEEGLLNINDKTSDYLGNGWTAMEPEKEDLITIWHQLTMTSGMNELFFDCVTAECLEYVTDAGSTWGYHNGPYTLLQSVVANASEQEWSNYFNERLRDRIGMNGFWLSTNEANNIYFSTARSMARFGLLNLNNGVWNEEIILGDEAYRNQMKNTSQNLNKAYGYLWWLNGKTSHRLPGLPTEFQGMLIPNAPFDTYAGLGKDDQKLYVVPSKGLVVVRLGEDAGEGPLGPSSFDNELWERLNALMD